MAGILELPDEVLMEILTLCPPFSLSSLVCSCRRLDKIVNDSHQKYHCSRILVSSMRAHPSSLRYTLISESIRNRAGRDVSYAAHLFLAVRSATRSTTDSGERQSDIFKHDADLLSSFISTFYPHLCSSVVAWRSHRQTNPNRRGLFGLPPRSGIRIVKKPYNLC